MTRKVFPGAWYADAVQGAYAVLYPDSSIETPQGLIGLPPAGNVLFLVCAIYDGNVVLAGQGHQDGQAWLYNGHEWRAVGPTYGTSPCAFGPQGLYVSMPGTAGNIAVINPLDFSKGFPLTQALGARGIALVSQDGQVHAQDVWYGLHGLAEFVDLDRVYVGQGANGGCVIQDRLLEPGNVQFVRAHRVGDALAVAMWKPEEKLAVCHWLQVSDIAQLPLVNAPPIVVPPQLPPVTEPPKMLTILTPPRAKAIVEALYARHVDLAKGSDDDRRALMWMIAQQQRYELGPGWGTKRAGEGRPLTKDAIAFWDGARLFVGDAFNGSTREPAVPALMDESPGQVFVEVPPADLLGVPPPIEPPTVPPTVPPTTPPTVPPSTELEVRVALLEQSVRRIVSQMHSV